MVSTDALLALLDEEKLSAAAAGRLQGLSAATVVRWITLGKRGIHLEGWRGEGKGWWTTREALARFLAALTNLELGRIGAAHPDRHAQSRREKQDRALAARKGIVLPEPGEVQRILRAGKTRQPKE